MDQARAKEVFRGTEEVPEQAHTSKPTREPMRLREPIVFLGSCLFTSRSTFPAGTGSRIAPGFNHRTTYSNFYIQS